MFGLGWLQLSAISLLVLIGAGGGAYVYGYQRGAHIAILEMQAANAKALAKAVAEARALGIAEGAITFTAGQHFAEVEQKIITRTITQIREVRVLVPPKADAACVVNAGFVQLHDDAARDPAAVALPGAAPEPADGPSGIALSEVGSTVAANYGTYYQVRAQLIELQGWVKKQEELHR